VQQPGDLFHGFDQARSGAVEPVGGDGIDPLLARGRRHSDSGTLAEALQPLRRGAGEQNRFGPQGDEAGWIQRRVGLLQIGGDVLAAGEAEDVLNVGLPAGDPQGALIGDQDGNRHRRQLGYPALNLLEAGLLAFHPGLRFGPPAGQRPQVEHVLEDPLHRVRILDIDGDPSPAQPFDERLGIAEGDDDQLRPQGEDALDVRVAESAHVRQPARRRGEIRVLVNADDQVSGLDGEQALGGAGGEGDHPASRAGEGHLGVQVVLRADRRRRRGGEPGAQAEDAHQAGDQENSAH